MLRVWRPSGEELVIMSENKLKDVAALKRNLCEFYGFPVYLQQLVHDNGVLADEIKLDACVDLQLLLLQVSDQTRDCAALDLMSAARKNHIKMARCLLECGAVKDSQAFLQKYRMTPLLIA
ncbi:Kidins220, partial [Symbiodinium microadriaticum]